jgi:uncharacterized membrane protein YkvA (DUF1232 family)
MPKLASVLSIAGRRIKPMVANKETDEEETVRRELPGKLRRTLGRVPFADPLVAAWFCARDPKTPAKVKAAIVGALVYFISPIDAIPDVLALVGFTDDAAVFWAVWRLVSKHITDAHREQAKDYLGML